MEGGGWRARSRSPPTSMPPIPASVSGVSGRRALDDSWCGGKLWRERERES